MTRKVRTPIQNVATVAPAARPQRGQHWRQVLIFVVTVMVYSTAVTSPLLFDDQTSIVSNASIRRLTPITAPLMPPRDTPVAGRPVVNLTLALNYAVGGLGTRGYHVVNILLHVLAALALFGVLRRAFRLPRLDAHFGRSADNLALAAALLWALHPLNSEVVNYLTQRSESLMGLFFLLTLYGAIRALDDTTPLWTIVAVGASLLGMASKESMVTAPLVVVLVDRLLVFDSWRAQWERRRTLYIGLAVSWLLLAALLATGPRSSVGFDAGTTVGTYFLNQLQLIPRYLMLAFWPRSLVLDYGLPQPLAFGDVLPGAGLLVVLGLATLVALWKWPLAGLLGAVFFLTLGPTSSFVPIATEVGAERRMYLPLAALVVLVVGGAYRLLAARRETAQDQRSGGLVPVVLVAIVAVLLSAGVLARNREYVSPLSIAQTIVDRWPSGRGYFLLASELFSEGRRDDALKAFEESAKTYPGALFALGTEYVAKGDYQNGVDALLRFIKAQPDHPVVIPAREMLSSVYLSAGRPDLAEEQLRLLLGRLPNHAAARRLLGDVRLRQNNPAQAVVEYQESLRLQPGQAETLGNLGVALSALNRFEEAANAMREVVVLTPQDSAAHLLLGRVLSVLRKYDDAEVEFQAAVELDPNNRDAQTNLESVRRLIARTAGPASAAAQR